MNSLSGYIEIPPFCIFLKGVGINTSVSEI